MSFDPWGQRRNLQNYQFIEGDVLAAFDSSITTRGFTGHEMVDGVGIIHMNGRIYDGKIGRFLQADPFIQAPFDTQSLNRYSYVRNNPLNKTDPSGYFWEAAVAAVYWAVGTYVVTDLLITLGAENLAALASIAGCAAGNVDTCAGASFGSNYAFTYDFGKASRAAAISYYSADLYGKAGNVTDTIGNAIANGFVGGIAAELGGGDFGDGFLSAGVSALAKPYIRGIGTDQYSGSRVAVRAILGGTISELTGGKFANGAVSAAMAQLFSKEANNSQSSDKGTTEGGGRTTVELRHKNIPGGDSLGNSDPYTFPQHAYVIVKDNVTGEEWISRAGPGGDGGNRIFGSIKGITTRNIKGATGDYGAQVNLSTTVLTTDLSSASVVDILSSFTASVNSSQISYNPLVRNSNSFAYQAVQTLTGARPPTQAWAPGAQTILKVD
jgi:RHS repeat-associated protein